MPKRIILIRHGEIQGNRDGAAYATVPDHKIPLTEQGKSQAYLAGKNVISGADFYTRTSEEVSLFVAINKSRLPLQLIDSAATSTVEVSPLMRFWLPSKLTMDSRRFMRDDEDEKSASKKA